MKFRDIQLLGEMAIETEQRQNTPPIPDEKNAKTSQILHRRRTGVKMRIEWPVYVFTACVFLAFAAGVAYLDLSNTAVVGLFLVLTVAYAWVAYVMIKQKAVLELHAYTTCDECSQATPKQGVYCMICGVKNSESDQ